MPPEVRAATDAYGEESDPLRDFINECCLRAEMARAKSSDASEFQSLLMETPLDDRLG